MAESLAALSAVTTADKWVPQMAVKMVDQMVAQMAMMTAVSTDAR